ncbi:ABC transporter substrate-binding protein [Mycetocola manganoxydans]|uniref:ABC transporter substrate-binding protein n=1 Tax=Mycetocola manganoxydans TaxID=699879 RepID=A0A3L6ZZF7_9MICO|nr:ABC transporter substrate-binding protein [Mycetocola manganoxydans]RLP73118.1 ABC transporter substrate-binding protein [Mycetocola manganoxydans]GHD44028.1 ABC transporter substrate-binding protein [Mycetocola manganoxydans]
MSRQTAVTRRWTPVRRATPIAAAALAAAMLLSSCAATPAAGGNSTEKNGGTLVYLDAELSSNTQLQSSGTWQDSAYIQNIGDRLIFRDPETLELKPWIAESWEISDDGLVYEFSIRDGVTYSDGTDLDAASVKRNLEWQAYGDAEKGIPANNWFPKVESVESDDAEQTVTVTLAAPSAPFLAVLSYWRTALAADATIDASIEKQSQISGFIGSGPFVVESETYGKEIVFTKRDGYAWAPPGVENQGEAYLDEIVVLPVTEDSVRLGSLRSGEADLIRYVQPSEEKTLEDAGLTVVGVQGIGNANVWDVRQSAPFLDDINVRKALQVGIDREQIVDDLYTDNWDAASSIITPGSIGYRDQSEKLAYNPEESNRLLDEAGWTERNADGIREKNGEPLSILTYVDVYDSTAKPLFQLVQWQLKQIGIDLEIKETDYASYVTTLEDPNVGVRRNGWPEADPLRLTVNYHSAYTNSLNLPTPDPKLDALLTDHITAIDPDERAAILGELQDYVVDQAYLLPILNDTQVFAYQPHIRDFEWGAEARPWFYNTWTEKK